MYEAAGVPPKVTANGPDSRLVPTPNPVPVMVTVVPPAKVPEFGFDVGDRRTVEVGVCHRRAVAGATQRDHPDLHRARGVSGRYRGDLSGRVDRVDGVDAVEGDGVGGRPCRRSWCR